MWIMTLRTVKGKPQADYDDETIQEGLEGCRMSLEAREAELCETCKRLGREALRRKMQSDMSGAKTKLMERRRALKRLEKLRNSLSLVDTQLDALWNTELDRELMNTLMASSAALKKAGVGTGVKEAEQVMSELDEQMREASELNSVLATQNIDLDMDFDMEEELKMFMEEESTIIEPPAVVTAIKDTKQVVKIPSPPKFIENNKIKDEEDDPAETVALLPVYSEGDTLEIQHSQNAMKSKRSSNSTRQTSRMIF